MKLLTESSRTQFQVSKPGYRRFTIFDEDVVGVEVVKTRALLDSPLYVGACVLELRYVEFYQSEL